jgi:hypothetical protein
VVTGAEDDDGQRVGGESGESGVESGVEGGLVVRGASGPVVSVF